MLSVEMSVGSWQARSQKRSVKALGGQDDNTVFGNPRKLFLHISQLDFAVTWNILPALHITEKCHGGKESDQREATLHIKY
jgi:hypothetical protein